MKELLHERDTLQQRVVALEAETAVYSKKLQTFEKSDELYRLNKKNFLI